MALGGDGLTLGTEHRPGYGVSLPLYLPCTFPDPSGYSLNGTRPVSIDSITDRL